MRKVTLHFWLLEVYALLLTFLQMQGGVRTDEAKYLLSIPYPHPPLLRSFFALFTAMPAQEFFVRFVLASLLVQAVWLLLDLGYILSPVRRMTLAASWLLSAAFVLQAGSIMMAPCTALFGLFFVWLSLRPEPLEARFVPLLGCVWFIALFSAYQSVLYLPLLVAVLRTAHVSWRRIFVLLGVPLVLLALYTLTNPLILASMLNAGTQDAPLGTGVRFANVVRIVLLAGSGFVSIAGLFGILTGGRWDHQLTLLLLLGFIATTSQQYYAILLTPILIAGMMTLLAKRRIIGALFLPLQIVATTVLVLQYHPELEPTPARETMRFLREHGITGPVLIDGYFGHEWQYESASPILRFTQTLSSSVEETAQAAVCTKKTCEEDFGDAWVKLDGAPVEVWAKKYVSKKVP